MLKWIAQYQAETNELVAQYRSVREASLTLGIPPSKLSDYIRLGYRLSGYYFRREGVSKEKLRQKKGLTIEEYLYLHEMKVSELARLLGVVQPTVSQYLAKKQRASSEIKEKMEALGIISEWEIDRKEKHPPARVKTTSYTFSCDREAMTSILSFVEKKAVGRIYCESKSEAYFISNILDQHHIMNYVAKTTRHGVFVKYDKTLKEERI